jgi:hypothetical protein
MVLLSNMQVGEICFFPSNTHSASILTNKRNHIMDARYQKEDNFVIFLEGRRRMLACSPYGRIIKLYLL